MTLLVSRQRPLISHAIAFLLGMQVAVFGVYNYKGSSDTTVICSQRIANSDIPTKSAADVGNEAIDVRKFDMPLRGKGYEIFQPLYDGSSGGENSSSRLLPTLIAPPDEFLHVFRERISWANAMVTRPQAFEGKTVSDHALLMYLEMMKSLVTATAYNTAEISVIPTTNKPILDTTAFDKDKREGGVDWTFAGDTMVGWKRLDNIRELLSDAIKKGVKGDYIETGVWRGGSSVYARAVMDLLEGAPHRRSNRTSYVCDSFRGLPPGDKHLDKLDANYDHTPYLEVPSDVVASNFAKYGMLNSNVVFVKGFFNNTMPPLSKRIKKLAVMRLDGDMYESTVDVLYHLYDKLSVGGYVIMDDWFGFPSRTACEDFFKVHGIGPAIIPIDELSAYWKKTEEVEIQYWRYEQSNFKPT